jgi:hypothetical protein
MKIWWPWRRKRQLLSLFDPPYGDDAEELLIELPPEWARSSEPHAKNAPGPFYVINAECITCGAPHVVAPDLVAWETDSEGGCSHCYFKKQPEDPYELTQAIAAVAASCCGALCYAGSDPEVIKRLRKAGAGNAIVKRR